jgi:energy-coupling factor transporter ATP-binding protein EcfA2
VKIAKIETKSLLWFPDAARSFSSAATNQPHPVIAITGGPGSGKTSLLEAILAAKETIAPHGRRSSRLWGRDNRSATVSIEWAFDEVERDFGGLDTPRVTTDCELGRALPSARNVGVFALLDRYRHDSSSGKLDYHASERTLPRTALSPTGSLERDQRLLRLSRDPAKYAALTRYLAEVDLGLRKSAVRESFGELFSRLTTSARFVGATLDDGPNLWFESATGAEMSVFELSDSEREAFVFAGTAAMIGLSRSILLVDRPEQAQAPSSILRFVEGLRSLGQDLQLIVATSSAELLTALPKDAIIDLGTAGGAR